MEQTNNNTIIFTMARMNPPTPGHLALIKTLIEQAIRMNVNKVFLILSKTNDNSDDPIPCDMNPSEPSIAFKTSIINPMVNVLKQHLIQTIINNVTMDESLKHTIISKIQNIEVILKCVPIVPKEPGVRQPTPFTPLYNIINTDFNGIPNINLFMIVGEDRATLLDSVADIFFKKIENVHSIDGIIMPREGMKEFKGLSLDQLRTLNMETVPVNAFSASFVRKIVKYGLRDKFNDIYRPYLDETAIQQLYDTISHGQLMKEPKNKGDDKVELSKYKYPLVKGGKRKHTKRKLKSKRKQYKFKNINKKQHKRTMKR